jgi:tRNA G46 methylase TrmB
MALVAIFAAGKKRACHRARSIALVASGDNEPAASASCMTGPFLQLRARHAARHAARFDTDPSAAELERRAKRAQTKRRLRRKRNRTLFHVENVLNALSDDWSTAHKSFHDVNAVREMYQIDWGAIQASADPFGKNKKGGNARGHRKRNQVESFHAILATSRCCPSGSTVVDFGCGTGNLLLPLAQLRPDVNFVGVDLNPRAAALLRTRASDAHLGNVTVIAGLIEEYAGPCDVALALHVCGSGTDAVLLQAQHRQAVFIVAPCCVGKIQDGGHTSVEGNKIRVRLPETKEPGGGWTSTNLQDITRPRSRWMRAHASREQYMDIARAADWSGHKGVTVDDPKLGRIPFMCKAAIEKDRGAAAEEVGYAVSLMKLLHDDVGIRDDVLVGFPAQTGDLLASALAARE